MSIADALEGITDLELDTDASLADQVTAIRRHHHKATGTRLSAMDAVRILDRIRAAWKAEAAALRSGFDLCCPFCYGGEEDLMVDLNNLSAVTCFRCDETFSAQQAHDEIAATLEPWAELLRYISAVEAKRAARLTPVPHPAGCQCHA